MLKALLDQLTVVLLQDELAQKADERDACELRGEIYNSDSDEENTAAGGYHVYDRAAMFFTDFGKGIPGGGNKASDAIIPNR